MSGTSRRFKSFLCVLWIKKIQGIKGEYSLPSNRARPRAITGDPDQEMLCKACNLEKGISAFSQQGTYDDGTPRARSICRSCDTKRIENYAMGRKTKRLRDVDAPVIAAQRLIAANPEALAYVIQRYYNDYVPLLEVARAELLAKRQYRLGLRQIRTALMAANPEFKGSKLRTDEIQIILASR